VREESKDLRDRIEAGRTAVAEQIPFFRENFGRVESRWKADASRVTDVDFRISESILGSLAKIFPADDFCSEESADAESQPLAAEYGWVLDPVDGTNNYALGIPHCAISLALLFRGDPVYGWIYDFPGDRVVHGGAGRGVFSDRKALDRGRRESGAAVPVGLQFPVDDGRVRRLTPLLARRKVRSLGSSTLEGMYIALGLMEGAVDFRVKVWDIAAFFALFPETEVESHFLEAPAFPLPSFSPDLPPCPYVAGSAEFVREVQELLASE